VLAGDRGGEVGVDVGDDHAQPFGGEPSRIARPIPRAPPVTTATHPAAADSDISISLTARCPTVTRADSVRPP
jgi:hypothetical protein